MGKVTLRGLPTVDRLSRTKVGELAGALEAPKRSGSASRRATVASPKNWVPPEDGASEPRVWKSPSRVVFPWASL